MSEFIFLYGHWPLTAGCQQFWGICFQDTSVLFNRVVVSCMHKILNKTKSYNFMCISVFIFSYIYGIASIPNSKLCLSQILAFLNNTALTVTILSVYDQTTESPARSIVWYVATWLYRMSNRDQLSPRLKYKVNKKPVKTVPLKQWQHINHSRLWI